MADYLGQEEKVICEIPVYLSKSLSKQLYILQYPQRPATVAIQKADIFETKIKPNLNKLQMTLGVEPNSPYYDEFHGEVLAEAAEGLGLNEDEYIPDTRKKIDKTVLESNCPPKLTNPARYVVGIIKDGAVHLTPLKSIVQMKTTLPFLNKADKAKAKLEAAAAGGDTEDEEEEATKVTLKFKRNPTDPNKTTTNKSSFSARKKEEEEPWTSLQYQEFHKDVYDKLFSSSIENDEPMYVLTRKDYLTKLFPLHCETVIDGSDKATKVPTAPKQLSIQKMKSLALPEQLKALLINGKVMRHDQIVEFLRSRLRVNPDETTLLRTLQTVAVLVQGCWVVRSEIIYPDGFKSNVNGVAGTIMQAARDFVLCFFTESRIVERKMLQSVLHLPDDELVEILNNIATRVIKTGWEFMLPFDNSFVERYPEVAKRQSLIWEVKNQHRNRKISESSKEKDGLKPPSRSPPRRRHSRTMSYSSDNDSGTETENHGGRRGSGSGSRQRRASSRSTSESSLLGVPSRVES